MEIKCTKLHQCQTILSSKYFFQFSCHLILINIFIFLNSNVNLHYLQQIKHTKKITGYNFSQWCIFFIAWGRLLTVSSIINVPKAEYWIYFVQWCIFCLVLWNWWNILWIFPRKKCTESRILDILGTMVFFSSCSLKWVHFFFQLQELEYTYTGCPTVTAADKNY